MALVLRIFALLLLSGVAAAAKDPLARQAEVAAAKQKIAQRRSEMEAKFGARVRANPDEVATGFREPGGPAGADGSEVPVETRPKDAPKADKHGKFWESARHAESQARKKKLATPKKGKPGRRDAPAAEEAAEKPTKKLKFDREALRAASEAKKQARAEARAAKFPDRPSADELRAKREAARQEADEMHALWCDDSHSSSILCKNWAAKVNGEKPSKEKHDVDEFWQMHETWCALEANQGKTPCKKWENKVKRETARASKRKAAPL